MKILYNKVPVLLMNFQLKPNQQREFTSLDWNLKFTELGIEFLKEFPQKLYEYEALSKFVRIPITNLSTTYEEALIKSIDILFARQLDLNYCVWWYSKNSYPDLGTKQINEIEGDTIFTALETKCEVSVPFMADQYVFEIDITSFYFNTLIFTKINNQQSEEFLNKKKSSKQKAMINNYSINNLLGFNIIKELFIKWYGETHLNKNEVANQLLSNLVRWMCDENSFFYDPYLKQTLDQKNKAMFEDFIHDVEELGAKVIYASPYKLLLSTKKKQYYSANNFIKFVLGSIIQNPKYSYLHMIIQQGFKIMIFKNIHNYAGVTVNLNELMNNQEVEESEVEKHIGFYSKWKLNKFLPPPVQQYFQKIIKVIIEKYYDYSKEAQQHHDYDANNQVAFFSRRMEEYLNGLFISEMSELLNYVKEQVRIFNFKIF